MSFLKVLNGENVFFSLKNSRKELGVWKTQTANSK